MFDQSLASTFGTRAWGPYSSGHVSHRSVTEDANHISAIQQSVRHETRGPTRKIEEAEDAYLVSSIMVSNPEYQLWDDRELVRCRPAKPMDVEFTDLRRCGRDYLPTIPDGVHFYLSRKWLAQLLELEEQAPDVELEPPSKGIDETLHGLASLFTPFFQADMELDRLYLSHLAMAVAWHVLRTYAGKSLGSTATSGYLSAARVKRAKELLSLAPTNSTSIDDIAHQCGLPPVRFVKAFEQTCGMHPMQWARSQRIELSKNRLFTTKLSLNEIAFECGFADQSHFNRTFVAATGFTPAVWRQARRGL